jgi:hypothetical protein
MSYFKRKQEENNLSIHNQYFKRDMSKLVNNPETYEAEKKRIIERYKDTHDFIDPKGGRISEEKFMIIHDGIEMLWEDVLLGNVLFFVNKFYEPFRVLDTDEEKEKLEKLIDENEVTEEEVKSVLNRKGFYSRRDFMDIAGEIQESDENGKLREKVLNPKTQKYECISILKENKVHSHYRKIDIDLDLFSVKTLLFACEEILKTRIKITEKKEEKPKLKITKK